MSQCQLQATALPSPPSSWVLGSHLPSPLCLENSLSGLHLFTPQRTQAGLPDEYPGRASGASDPSQMSSSEQLGQEITLLSPPLTPVVGQGAGQVTLPLIASASSKWVQNGIQALGSLQPHRTQTQQATVTMQPFDVSSVAYGLRRKTTLPTQPGLSEEPVNSAPYMWAGLGKAARDPCTVEQRRGKELGVSSASVTAGIKYQSH